MSIPWSVQQTVVGDFPHLLILYAVAIFVAAVLMFLVQPMIGKMVLPLFGGTSSVWNTCVLFFQSALLAGYGYAHLSGTYLGFRKQATLHFILLVLGLFMLPMWIGEAWAPTAQMPPVLWLLFLLIAVVGPPFFVVSATAPLVQRWFSRTGHRAAKDPYFLYSASNFGSLLALLAYPFVLEPLLPLYQHSWIWTGGYVLLLFCLAACVATSWRRSEPQETKPEPKPTSTKSAPPHQQPDWRMRLRWVLLAFVPSSLMLSVTTYLTTDIAAIPLLWVMPLSIYLITFILAFARRQYISQWAIERIMPLVVVLLAILLLAEGLEPPAWLLLPLHLGGLFVIALACHGQLARLRPSVLQLTEYYLWISMGGVLGGVFNALLAPMLFSAVTEYPLVIVLACLLRSAPQSGNESTPTNWRSIVRLDLVPAIGVGVATLALIGLASILELPRGPASIAAIAGVPAVVCYTFLHRPLRFGLAIGALFLAGSFYPSAYGDVVFAQRSFFGIHRVTRDTDGYFLRLVHGNTVHGLQSLVPGRRDEPLTYYSRTGPIGKVFAALDKAAIPYDDVAVIGLGVGSLAAYSKPGQEWAFYEIDPVVLYLARDWGKFTFWKDAPAKLNAVLGDARLRLAESDEPEYDLLIVDAFNSDAVPLHLLTREALQVYLKRLKPRGLLAFHISNRYLDLAPVLAELANDAGLHGLHWDDRAVVDADRQEGKFPSHWVVLSKDPSLLDPIRRSAPWQPLAPGNRRYLWTDDFSNLFGVFKWQDTGE